MKRRTAFAVAAGPVLAWIPVGLWLHAHLDEWIASKTVLPLAVRLALYVDNELIRLMPFVILAIALAMPLLVWGASKLEAPGSDGHVRSLASWLCLTLGLQPAAWVVLWVARSPSLVVALLPIWWAGIVAYVLALGAAVAVQRDRRNAGRSSWRPRTVLWVGWLATFVGGAGFLVPALVWWGAWRDRRRTDAARAPMPS